MVFNVVLDAAVGALPLVGDAFDLLWKANRKNLRLVQRYQDPGAPRKPRASDYAVLSVVALLLVCAVALPVLVAGTLVGYLVLHGRGAS
jgi:hypothetical protein